MQFTNTNMGAELEPQDSFPHDNLIFLILGFFNPEVLMIEIQKSNQFFVLEIQSFFI